MDEHKRKERLEMLTEVGFDEDSSRALLEQLQLDVANSLGYELLQVFSEEEARQMEKKFKESGMNSLERLSYITDLYTKIMEVTPVERAMHLMDKYIRFIVQSVKNIRELTAKLDGTKKDLITKLDNAIKSKDWEKVKPILDKIGIEEESLMVKV